MALIECGTQAELDAVRAPDVAVVRKGHFTACGSSQVRAYGSSQVAACGSSQVTAYDSSQVTAYGSSQVTATPHVAVTRSGKRARVHGGVLIDIPHIETTEAWLAYYGIEATKAGYVTLYKGVDADLISGHGFAYPLGRGELVCLDWAPTNACGGGLHLSPRPFMTHLYCTPERYVACKVRVADIVPITSGDGRSDKCKVRAIVERWEVDEDGERLATPAKAAA